MRAKKIAAPCHTAAPSTAAPLLWPRSDPEPIWFLKLDVGVLNFDMAVFDASFGGSGGNVGEMWGKVGVFLYRVPIFRDFLVKSGDF